MDNYNILTDKLKSLNGGLITTNLICEPTDEQMKRLKEGSGNPEAEMKQVNSSAGLAVNYWRAYEMCHNDASVEFEWKKRRPLQYGTPANIDVVIREKNHVWFVESKFLEPYYSGNETPVDSYEDVSKYSSNTKDAPESWVALFRSTKSFQYYNVTQLCRHLLAISKDIIKTPRYYRGKDVMLISAVWDMPDSFLRLFTDEECDILSSRRQVIREEAAKSEIFFNQFIDKHLPDMSIKYRAIKYNDIIEHILDQQLLTKLKQQYYL